MTNPRFPLPRRAFGGSVALATAAHLGGILLLLGAVVNYAVVIAVLPAALVLILAKPADAATRDEAREAVNFQITAALVIVVVQLLGRFGGLGLWNVGSRSAAVAFFAATVLVNAALGLAAAVLAVRAAFRIRAGGGYRYPLTIRLIPTPRRAP